MLSWMASCCHGSPKNGPMAEEAGVTSCRPAIVQAEAGEAGEGVGVGGLVSSLLTSSLSHFILLSPEFTRCEENGITASYH